jgi:hypothetical protein
MPYPLISLRKHVPRFLMHVNSVLISRFHIAVLLAIWGGHSYFHTYLWLEAGGIHPVQELNMEFLLSTKLISMLFTNSFHTSKRIVASPLQIPIS